MLNIVKGFKRYDFLRLLKFYVRVENFSHLCNQTLNSEQHRLTWGKKKSLGVKKPPGFGLAMWFFIEFLIPRPTRSCPGSWGKKKPLG